MVRRILENILELFISNWTEMDVWQYIMKENIKILLYIFLTKENIRNNVVMAKTDFIKTKPEEKVQKMRVI